MPIITLLTDFGTIDTYAGQMKGVIAGIAPSATVIDLTHHIPPQNLLAGAIELDAALDAFPDGAIHVGIVDPGVGSKRRSIAMQTERFTFVGPDNGLCTALAQRNEPRQTVELTEAAYHCRTLSATFQGRAVFAPVAAHLANGVPLEAMGEPVADPVQLDLPRPERTDTTITGAVVLIDHFGNCVTNINADDLPLDDRPASARDTHIDAGDTRIVGIAHTFSDVKEGEPLAYPGTMGRLEIAIRNGSAASTMNLRRGDPVTLQHV